MSTQTSVPSTARHLVRNYATVLLLLALVVLFSLASPQFLTLGNIQSLLLVQAIVTLMTFGVMSPLIVGEFDLSVGNLIGFLAILGAYLAGRGSDWPVVATAMVATGVVVGLINGLLTQAARISSFIATLATGIILLGLTQGLSGGQVLFSNIPKVIKQIGAGYAGPLAISVWIVIVIAGLMFYLLEQTPLGRSLYAVGGSERVSFLAGLRTSRLKVLAFTMSGFFVGLASIVALGQSGSANPGFGPDLLLPAYAAAFLGVTTYRAGFYNVIGSVVGILLLSVGFNGLSLLGVPFWVQPVFNGGVLLVAVLVARAEARTVRVGG